jgi:hypothetical protein
MIPALLALSPVGLLHSLLLLSLVLLKLPLLHFVIVLVPSIVLIFVVDDEEIVLVHGFFLFCCRWLSSSFVICYGSLVRFFFSFLQ